MRSTGVLLVLSSLFSTASAIDSDHQSSATKSYRAVGCDDHSLLSVLVFFWLHIAPFEILTQGCNSQTMKRFPNSLRMLAGLAGGLLLSGCSYLIHQPQEQTLDQRFESVADAAAPITAPMTIRWNQHAVPYVQAANNQDLAFGVGMVHAHLRLGQMTVMKMIAQGRISELAGPVPQVATIDHALRMINLCGSGEKSLAVMSERGREWIHHFTRGINWYIERMETPTSEHKALNMAFETMTEQDVMCVARLVSADLTWAVYFKFLKLAEQPGWQEAFDYLVNKRLTDSATATSNNELNPSITQPVTHRPQADDAIQVLSQLFMQFSKSGSNSVAIHRSRSATGAALIANDPHVGLTLPNFWLLIGMQSPEIQTVGLTIPGVPVIGVGRNPNIAWGGTNMRAISSHLIDVSELPDDQITSRTETIKRRGWWSTERTIRETRFGPILTDLALFDQDKLPYTAALDWVGRQGSDEITAFMDVSRASNWTEFREAFEPYQVSAFNMLYADHDGNIGMLPAYGQPVLSQTDKTLDLVKSRHNRIVGIRSPIEQTNPFNPERGYIASANNKPFADPAIPYAYSFSNNDRFDRLTDLAESTPAVTLNDLKQWQRDTFSHGSHEIRRILLERAPLDNVNDQESVYQNLLDWDGYYRSDSRGAVAFEGVMAAAWEEYCQQPEHSALMQEYLKKDENWKPVIRQWLIALPQETLVDSLNQWIRVAAKNTDEKTVWGDIQRQPQNPALGMVPYVGSRYRLKDYPAEGGNDTLFKSVHALGTDKQDAYYGSSARHISDLSSLDENYFVLHGGQDGWLKSPNMNDQTVLWRKGEYIRMPLSPEVIEQTFNRFVTQLTPAY